MTKHPMLMNGTPETLRAGIWDPLKDMGLEPIRIEMNVMDYVNILKKGVGLMIPSEDMKSIEKGVMGKFRGVDIIIDGSIQSGKFRVSDNLEGIHYFCCGSFVRMCLNPECIIDEILSI